MDTFTDWQVIDELLKMLDTWPTVTAIEYNAQSQSTLIQADHDKYVIMQLIGGQKKETTLTQHALKDALCQHIAQIRFINATFHGLAIARFVRQTTDAWHLTLQKNTAGRPIDLTEAQNLLGSTKGHC